MKTAWGRGHLRRFPLMEGDTILAAATQYGLAGALDRRPIRICGLGGIFVDSTTCDGHRARGLIDRLLDRARDDGADFALLFSGDELDHCGQHGFETLALPETQRHVAEPTRRCAPMTMIRSGEERDFHAIVAMGQVRARDVRFHLDRNVDLVHHAITRKGRCAVLAE